MAKEAYSKNNEISRIVRMGSEALAQAPRRHLSDKTREHYKTIIRRLENRPPGDRDFTRIDGARSTFYVRRAAIRWWATEQLRDDLRTIREMATAAKNGDAKGHVGNVDTILRRIEENASLLRLLPTDNDRGDALKQGRKSAFKGDGSPVLSYNKRKLLGRLPKTWRDDMLRKALDARSKYSEAVAVLYATGCRPAELEAGVRLIAVDDDHFIAEISGAKVSADTGQTWRRLTLARDHDAATRCLAALLHSGEAIVSVRSAKMLGQSVGHLSSGLWPRRHLTEAVTPYCFRHAFSADLKADGWSKQDIAAALGQQSDRTQSHYGMSRQGRKSKRIVAIEAAAPVRSSPDRDFKRKAN